MSNYKTNLQNNNTAISENNTDLQSLIEQANNLPDAVNDSVLYTEQTLTDEQKLQARENIDAISTGTITYGTEDMTAGTTALATGKLYFVYE